MSEQPERDREHEAPARVREPYAPPRLVRHGTIEDLTRGLVLGPGPSDQDSFL